MHVVSANAEGVSFNISMSPLPELIVNMCADSLLGLLSYLHFEGACANNSGGGY